MLESVILVAIPRIPVTAKFAVVVQGVRNSTLLNEPFTDYRAPLNMINCRCRGTSDLLRPGESLIQDSDRVLLQDARSDNCQPPRTGRRHAVPLGYLLPQSRAERDSR